MKVELKKIKKRNKRNALHLGLGVRAWRARNGSLCLRGKKYIINGQNFWSCNWVEDGILEFGFGICNDSIRFYPMDIRSKLADWYGVNEIIHIEEGKFSFDIHQVYTANREMDAKVLLTDGERISSEEVYYEYFPEGTNSNIHDFMDHDIYHNATFALCQEGESGSKKILFLKEKKKDKKIKERIENNKIETIIVQSYLRSGYSFRQFDKQQMYDSISCFTDKTLDNLVQKYRKDLANCEDWRTGPKAEMQKRLELVKLWKKERMSLTSFPGIENWISILKENSGIVDYQIVSEFIDNYQNFSLVEQWIKLENILICFSSHSYGEHNLRLKFNLNEVSRKIERKISILI